MGDAILLQWNISWNTFIWRKGTFFLFSNTRVEYGRFSGFRLWLERRLSPLTSLPQPNWPALLDIIYRLCLTWQPWWQDKCPITHSSVRQKMRGHVHMCVYVCWGNLNLAKVNGSFQPSSPSPSHCFLAIPSSVHILIHLLYFSLSLSLFVCMCC